MKNVSYKFIPNCLRKYRKARGLSQKKVAQILSIKNASTISRWEKGVGLPNSLNVFKLAALYRVLADALFFNLIKLLRDKVKQKEKELMGQ